MSTPTRVGRVLAASAAMALLGAAFTGAGAAQAADPATAEFVVAGLGGSLTRIPAGSEIGGATVRPRGVAATPSGTYIVAAGNDGLLEYSPDGSVEPFAPQVEFFFPFGVVVAPDGDVLVSDAGSGTVTRIQADGLSSEVVAEGLQRPSGMALRGPDLLVAQSRGESVVAIAPDGTVSTFTDLVAAPADVSVAPDNSVLITDQGQNSVVRVTGPGETPTVVVARLNLPTGVVTDADGGVYVGEFSGNRVLYVAEDGGEVTTFAQVNQPSDLTTVSYQPQPGTPQAITFTTDAPGDAVVGGTYDPAATGGGSGNEVTFSTTTPDTCEYDDEAGEVVFVGAGRCTVTADQAGGTKDGVTYADAETKTQDVTVGRGAQVIDFDEGSPTTGTVGGAFFPSAEGGNSGNPVTFSIDEDSADVCRIVRGAEGRPVVFTAKGTCVVNADQVGDEDYEAATTAQLSIAVDVAPTTLELVPSEDGLTATVRSSGESDAPSGRVTFTLDDEILISAALNPIPNDSQAAVAVVINGAGRSGLLKATYAGNAALGGSEDSYQRTAPTLQVSIDAGGAEPNEAGWYRDPVQVDFTCTTGTAELVGECPASFRRANTGADFTISRMIVATDGGRASFYKELRVDSRGPVLDIRRVGQPAYARTARPVRCEAVDGRSGLDGNCRVTYSGVFRGPNGAAVRSWTATATDIADNTSSQSGRFRVTGPAPRTKSSTVAR